MAAASSLKRKSDVVDDAYQDPDGVRTPTGSPSRKKMRITRKQKQALIDNLQLETRRLRAQYALQTHDLGARIERRVNRIPVSLRKANMGELWEKHQALMRAQASPRKITSPAKSSRNVTNISVGHEKPQSHTATGNRRVKKPSHEGVYSDKENAVAAGDSIDALSNPKKRGKAVGTGGASRMVSQEVRGAESRILSPKSQNSRTYPQSPFRGFAERSQQSGYLSKPVSPLKPSSPLRANSSVNSGASAATSTAAHGKYASQSSRPGSRAGPAASKGARSPLPRPATRQVERRNSVSSNASSGTTVVRPTKTGTGARKATAGAGAGAGAAATAKKPAAARTQAPANVKKTAVSTTAAAAAGKRAPTPTGDAGRNRTLRKRA